MNPGVISAKDLTKVYKLYSKHTDRLKELLFFRPLHKKKSVLNKINFNVEAGRALGILGLNGSGKSTLLKLLAGLSKPTSGMLHIQGKLIALIELGAGFHLELTGRENISFCGILYGMTKKEMKLKMTDILSFAAIGDYIDQPVKFYSAGMYLRLAFSLAIHSTPDIFLLDEIFSVGDINFQFKCAEKLHEFKAQGKTLIFVSHDLHAISSLCDEAMILHEGQILAHGNTQEIIDKYHALSHAFLSQERNREVTITEDSMKISSDTGHVSLESLYLIDSQQRKINVVQFDEVITLRCHFKIINTPHPNSMIGVIIKNRLGIEIFSINSYDEGISFQNIKDQKNLVIDFSFKASLNPGGFSVTLAWAPNHFEPLYYLHIDRVLVFQVLPPPPPRRGLPGLCHLPSKISFPKDEYYSKS